MPTCLYTLKVTRGQNSKLETEPIDTNKIG